jgi:hypothetical protein
MGGLTLSKLKAQELNYFLSSTAAEHGLGRECEDENEWEFSQLAGTKMIVQ